MRFAIVLIAFSAGALSSACSEHGATNPIQTERAIPSPGAVSAGYAGPQGIFDAPNGTFEPIITVLDTGEIYGMDLIENRVAGFFHGTVNASGANITSTDLTEYNAMDGGYIQAAGLSATYTNPALKVSLTFPFGTFDSVANGQKTYSSDRTQAIYTTPVALTEIAGNYDGELSTVGTTMERYSDISRFVLSGDGTFSAATRTCTFNGKFVKHGNSGAFDATADIGGSTCAIAGMMRGIMTPVTVSAAKISLGIPMLTADGKKSAILFVVKH